MHSSRVCSLPRTFRQHACDCVAADISHSALPTSGCCCPPPEGAKPRRVRIGNCAAVRVVEKVAMSAVQRLQNEPMVFSNLPCRNMGRSRVAALMPNASSRLPLPDEFQFRRKAQWFPLRHDSGRDPFIVATDSVDPVAPGARRLHPIAFPRPCTQSGHGQFRIGGEGAANDRSKRNSADGEILRGHLSVAAGNEVKRNLLTLVKLRQSGPFDCTDVHKGVLGAVGKAQ